jgi:hypothetical protein
VSVVRRYTRRRWLAVGGAAAALAALPPVVAAWPVATPAVTPKGLLAKILGSAGVAYQGYVDSHGRLSLPDVPQLGDAVNLLSGQTSIRAWYARPAAWRVAAVDQLGEKDIYRTADGTYVWDFQRNLMTLVAGPVPVRLPWAADLVPPDLARRLLRGAAPGDPIDPLPARRVAGLAAAGVRLRPADPDTTVGRIDVWADPDTGLPLLVEAAARDAGTPVLSTQFLDLERTAPDPALLIPNRSLSAGFTMTTQPDIAAAVNAQVPVRLPANLAGRGRQPSPGGIAGVAAYGLGFGAFAVVPLPDRAGTDAIDSARKNRALPVTLPRGVGYQIGASMLTAVVVRRRRGQVLLLTGFVAADLLIRAATELAEEPLR